MHACYLSPTKLATSKLHQCKNEQCSINIDGLCAHLHAIMRYYASDICLHIGPDATFSVLLKARCRGVEHLYFSNRVLDYVKQPNPKPNGTILIGCVILQNVMTLAAEYETQIVFHNEKATIPIRIAVEELGHHLPVTASNIDNNTSDDMLNAAIQQMGLKHYDMKIWCFREK